MWYGREFYLSIFLLSSIFFLLRTNNFFQVVLIRIEQFRIVQMNRFLPLIGHQAETTSFEDSLLQFHLFEITQTGGALIEDEARLWRNKLAEQFSVTKINLDILHTEDTLVRCWKIGIVDLRRSVIIWIVLNIGFRLSSVNGRGGTSVRTSGWFTFRWTEKKLFASLTQSFVMPWFVLNPFI